MFKSIGSLIFLLTFFCLCEGATLHTILVGDTFEGETSYSTQCSLDMMERQMQRVAAYCGMDLHVAVFEGMQTRIRNVTNYFDEVNVGPDDVVVLYFAIHGSRDKNKISPWPDLMFPLDLEYLDFELAFTTFAAKNPRLLLALADSCNSVRFDFPIDDDHESNVMPDPLTGPTFNYEMGAETFDLTFFMEEIDKINNYRSLFLDINGAIIVSASSPGETAWRDSTMTGGYLTYYFLESLRTSDPNWLAILDRTKAKVTQKTEFLKKYAAEHGVTISPQTVQYEIH